MSDDTYYAWAPISHKNEDGSDASIKVGDEVPSDLLSSMDRATKNSWIRDGAIRKAKFPKDVPDGLSVRTHLLRKANEAYENAQKIGSPTVTADPVAENPSAVNPNSESPAAATAEQPQQQPQQPQAQQ